MKSKTTVRFPLGQVVATLGAIEALRKNHSTGTEYLRRHASGDWGDVGEDDQRANDEALESGARLLSSYTLADGAKLWVITDAAEESGRRSTTTLLLPDEY